MNLSCCAWGAHKLNFCCTRHALQRLSSSASQHTFPTIVPPLLSPLLHTYPPGHPPALLNALAMLQAKRLHSPALVVTNHDATMVPAKMALAMDGWGGGQHLSFDRILCDVPCSGATPPQPSTPSPRRPTPTPNPPYQTQPNSAQPTQPNPTQPNPARPNSTQTQLKSRLNSTSQPSLSPTHPTQAMAPCGSLPISGGGGVTVWRLASTARS